MEDIEMFKYRYSEADEKWHGEFPEEGEGSFGAEEIERIEVNEYDGLYAVEISLKNGDRICPDYTAWGKIEDAFEEAVWWAREIAVEAGVKYRWTIFGEEGVLNGQSHHRELRADGLPGGRGAGAPPLPRVRGGV